MHSVAPPKTGVRHNGEAIKVIRVLRGQSRKDVANAVGCGYSHIANLELEEKAASPELIDRLAEVLDSPIAALLRDSDSGRRHNGEAMKVIRVLRGQSRADVAKAVGCGYSHIANLELEEKAASPELINRIARTLDIPTKALLRCPEFATEASHGR